MTVFDQLMQAFKTALNVYEFRAAQTAVKNNAHLLTDVELAVLVGEEMAAREFITLYLARCGRSWPAEEGPCRTS